MPSVQAASTQNYVELFLGRDGMKSRRFREGAPNHIYVRFKESRSMIYSLEDCLVYYTIYGINVKKHSIRSYGMVIMYDHSHHLAESGSKEVLSTFEKDVSYSYTKEFLRDLYGGCEETRPKGGLFQTPFGSAPKVGGKKIRTAVAYLYNNPVERHITKSAMEWKWCFLAYCDNDHPFSRKLVIRQASRKLRAGIKEVRWCRSEGMYLRHAQIRRMMEGMKEYEKLQLIDFIIVTYSATDYQSLIELYGSFEKAVMAINSNTGNEYDIKEETYRNSDRAYGEMIKWVENSGIVKQVKKVVLLPQEEKTDLKRKLMNETSADEWQVSKFLWLAPPRTRHP